MNAVFISNAVWLSIWSLQILCSRLFGGSLDFIGYLLVAKTWQVTHLNSTGEHTFLQLILVSQKYQYWFWELFWISQIYSFKLVLKYHFRLLTLVSVLQALYHIFGIWCVFCCYLCCRGLCHWYCCMLLSSMYNSNLIYSGGSGKSWQIMLLPLI